MKGTNVGDMDIEAELENTIYLLKAIAAGAHRSREEILVRVSTAEAVIAKARDARRELARQRESFRAMADQCRAEGIKVAAAK